MTAHSSANDWSRSSPTYRASTLDLEACRLKDYDKDEVVELFRDLEFRSLVDRLPDSNRPSGEWRAERSSRPPASLPCLPR